jgi:N-acylglucosamine 2-epimerase
MDRTTIDRLLPIYRDGLLEDVLPFWLRHAPDEKFGGFRFFLDADGSPLSGDKAMWTTCRFVWLLSRLCNTVEPREEWLRWAKHGMDFIRKHGFDSDGRMWYSVTRDGTPLRKRRYLFTETFGVIALAEYARAAGDDEARQQARDLYRLILRYHTTPGLLEPKGVPGTRPMKSHAMPMILMATTRVLREVDDDPLYTEVVDGALHEVLHHFLKPEYKCLLENVGPDGEFIDEPAGREVNPGHAIETAWFIMEEARARENDAALIESASKILDWSLEIGWDEEFGGLYYFRDCKGLPCAQYEHDMKLWWPHTEALYATLLAHHLTGKARYLDWHDKVREWTYAHFPDPEHGEWFGYLHRDGTVSHRLKGNMWKGPFHTPRMLLNCCQLLEECAGTESVQP